MNHPGIGFTRITASTIINEDATLFYGCLVLSSKHEAGIILYEGLDAISGRLIATIYGADDITLPVLLPQPLYLDRGLFVVFGDDVREATIFWLPASIG